MGFTTIKISIVNIFGLKEGNRQAGFLLSNDVVRCTTRNFSRFIGHNSIWH